MYFSRYLVVQGRTTKVLLRYITAAGGSTKRAYGGLANLSVAYLRSDNFFFCYPATPAYTLLHIR